MWYKIVRWLAREHLKYLEYENRELRFEMQRWHDRYEGAMAAIRVFEARSNAMWNTLADAKALEPTPPIILKKEG